MEHYSSTPSTSVCIASGYCGWMDDVIEKEDSHIVDGLLIFKWHTFSQHGLICPRFRAM